MGENEKQNPQVEVNENDEFRDEDLEGIAGGESHRYLI